MLALHVATIREAQADGNADDPGARSGRRMRGSASRQPGMAGPWKPKSGPFSTSGWMPSTGRTRSRQPHPARFQGPRRRPGAPRPQQRTAARGGVRSVIVLDTNVISELARQVPDPGRCSPGSTHSKSSEVATTAITAAELRYGVARLPDGHRKRRADSGASAASWPKTSTAGFFPSMSAPPCGMRTSSPAASESAGPSASPTPSRSHLPRPGRHPGHPQHCLTSRKRESN